ncbi:3-mercaptopyruvate sulfurtransferase [Rhodoblastus sphagnicola]|uniref:3-mercaptopyruvate sulfurtransferase n=1 Tax=Rhodoblastus sphagnicola TaxID=333368 RepID=A0A2S6NEY2_9HYPH|nr:3-mercaptopyruvate sulfurtransferase [Rhodoblastus sphagnicola]MBB4196419.1 thiosulfate/3-mercaptopyruvate sulfurtransferase [Rhodoblastus sphagnicola]PPQ33134.1 3-mercaptopyruvate sulfurtransferase [Rhodoblastus sphagnicola]
MTGLKEDYLVSTDWLAQHLGAPGLAIVDASWHLPTANRDAKDEFLKQHIPHAVHFDIDAIADTSSNLPHMLPDAVTFSGAVRKLGIGDGMKIVVYDAVGLFSAPRVWWTFRVFGARDVVILDGGLPKWLAEGRPVADGPALPRSRHFTARLDHGLVASVEDARAASEKKTAQIVDARSAARFRGDEIEPRPGLRSGHIPGARNCPWTELVHDGGLRPRAELEAAFARAGFDPAKPVLTTCGSGVSASILSFALANAGHDIAPVYDGSWSEWGQVSDRPVAIGPA